MALRKRSEAKKEDSFVWTYQGDRPVFLVPVEGNLQWVDSHGYHVGDSGANQGHIKFSDAPKNSLAKLFGDLTETTQEESMETIEVLAAELQSYPEGSTVYYTYAEGEPMLEDELEDEEFETVFEQPEQQKAVAEVETAVEKALQDEKVKTEVTPVVEDKKRVNDYSSVSRQTLLHHLRKYDIKVVRGTEEKTIIEIIQAADAGDWDVVKSHQSVNMVKGAKTKSIPTAAEATALAREITKHMTEKHPDSPPKTEEPVAAVEEEDTFLTVGELVKKSQGYTWKFSLDEISQTFDGQDFKIISVIYGAEDNEEIAFRLARSFDLNPLQLTKLLEGFVYGVDEYPSLIELLMDSDIIE